MDSTNLSVIQCFSAPASTQRISFVQPADCPFLQLLRDRPALTTPAFDRVQPTHGVELHIETTGPPVFARPRRLAPDKLAAAKKEFELMEKLGIIRKSSSPWSSPLHIVPKRDGGFRPCGDFRRLNNVTTPDRYPIPYLSDATWRERPSFLRWILYEVTTRFQCTRTASRRRPSSPPSASTSGSAFPLGSRMRPRSSRG